MKAVLISINPKWCKLIASGKKTVEVRKTKPKLETPFKVYIYCTKGLPTFTQSAFCDEISNGKVVGEFVCDRITKGNFYLKDACLTSEEYIAYCPYDAPYAWHISDLVIYDKPRESSEFKRFVDRSKGQRYHEDMLYLQRPPQSWSYVEV